MGGGKGGAGCGNVINDDNRGIYFYVRRYSNFVCVFPVGVSLVPRSGLFLRHAVALPLQERKAKAVGAFVCSGVSKSGGKEMAVGK